MYFLYGNGDSVGTSALAELVEGMGHLGPEQENRSVEERIENAMAAFDYAGTGYCLDTSPGRLMYFYYNPEQYFKYIRPVKRV